MEDARSEKQEIISETLKEKKSVWKRKENIWKGNLSSFLDFYFGQRLKEKCRATKNSRSAYLILFWSSFFSNGFFYGRSFTIIFPLPLRLLHHLGNTLFLFSGIFLLLSFIFLVTFIFRHLRTIIGHPKNPFYFL